MREKTKKIFCLVLVILSFFIAFQNITFADDQTGMDEIISEGDSFREAGKKQTISKKALETTSNYIYNTLFAIAVVLAVAVGLILGIQFITGSVEEQAKIKESLIPYVVGVFVVFSVFPIWKIAVKLGNDVTKPTVIVSDGETDEEPDEEPDEKPDEDNEKTLLSTDKVYVPEYRTQDSSTEEKTKRERMVKFAELFIDAANEGGKPKVVYFKGAVNGKAYFEEERITRSFEGKATKLRIFNQEPKMLFDCTGFVSFIYKETTGLMKNRGYLNYYIKYTEGSYQTHTSSIYSNFMCMGKIKDLKNTDAYIRPGDIIALMKSEEAGDPGRHTMMYIGPEKKIKDLGVGDIRIAHVTSGNFISYNTGYCKIDGESISAEYKEKYKENYNNGGVFNSSFRPYITKHSIDDLYVIIAKNDAFTSSSESDVVQDTLSKGYFDWDLHIKE